MQVAHNNGIKTDNRLHNLRYDTAKGNAADRIKHGTQVRGEDSHNAKLNRDQVEEIVLRILNGDRQATIAEDYGVDKATISSIAIGRNWNWVAEEMGIKIVPRKRDKLVDSDVIEIRRLLNSGVRGCDISKQYNISQQRVCDIRKGRGWKRIGDAA
jgi:hypothetical protein